MSRIAEGSERILIGVGVGPGDPELVTCKAVRILGNADVVFVPDTEASSGGQGRAEAIIRAACPEAISKIRRIPFSMAERTGVGAMRRRAWETSADAVEQAFLSGARMVAFATVGDPSVYSTFSYLAAQVCERIAEVGVDVVPGITAMQALAAASRVPLVEGQETLALVPATAGPDRLEKALSYADCVVLYKVGRRLDEVTRLLREQGRYDQAVLGVDIGTPGERTIPLSESLAEDQPYFSTILIPPARTGTGGRL